MNLQALDGGKGDAFLLNDGESNYLIDGGNKTIADNALPNHINVVIITHNDNDHLAGLVTILKKSKLTIDEIWLPGLWQPILQFISDCSISDSEIDFSPIKGKGESINELLSISEMPLRENEDKYLSKINSIAFSPYHTIFFSHHRMRRMISTEIAINLDNIIQVAGLAYSSGIHIRWFLPQNTIENEIHGNFIALNSREIVYIHKIRNNNLAMFKKMCELSIENKYSLVFHYQFENEPVILFTGDSDLSFTSLLSYKNNIIITAPHHGSESNSIVYSKISSPRNIFIRSGGTSTQLPGNTFEEQSNKVCNICRKNKWPYIKTEIIYHNNQWITKCGYQCP